jgi:acetolactate synthase-1/2/3 large subunit
MAGSILNGPQIDQQEDPMADPKRLLGSQLVAKALQVEGVQNVFTLAGDHILPVLDVIGDMGFRIVDTRHEQAAVHMADAWGRITGQPGVAMYTTPGLANAIPGLANAMHSESPLLSISGSAELQELGRGAMQEIDQTGMARPTTKGAWMVTDPRRIPDMIAHALRVAYSGRRGPVHLTIPVDIQQQEVSADDVTFYQPSEYRSTAPAPAPDDQVRDAVDLLRTASRPLIIAGSAAAYGASGDALQRFIETTCLPVMTEGDARGLVSDEHPYCLGFFDSGLNRAARMLREADVVVLLGRKQDLIVGYAMAPAIPADARLIQVDPSATEIGRNRGVAIGIVGDIQAVVGQLAAEAARHTWNELPWLETLRAERKAQAEELESLAVPETPMHAMYVHKILRRHLTPDDILVFDGGDACHFARAYLPAVRPKSWWYLPTLGMLGSGLPTAMAAKLANPDRRVIMLTGDGSFGFNGMEFDTAVRHNLPVVAIMCNDAAWGVDRQIQLGVFGKPVATDLLPTRYDQVVRGLGAHGEHVETAEELGPAIERAFKMERPALINVMVQRAISPRAEAAIARWKSHTPQPL